jgi:hypothetical protein
MAPDPAALVDAMDRAASMLRASAARAGTVD